MMKAIYSRDKTCRNYKQLCKILLEQHGVFSFNTSEKAKIIRMFFSNLAEFFWKILSEGASKFGLKKRTILPWGRKN